MVALKAKLICCHALKHLIMLHNTTEFSEIVTLDVQLHLNPDNLRARLQHEIDRLEEDGCDIVLAYGLCGRSVERLKSKKSRLIIPKVDDCVGLLLGSRERHREIQAESPGSFFLEPDWIGTEMDIFCQCKKGLDGFSEEQRERIVRLALKHYSTLGLIEHVERSEVLAECKQLADNHGLDFKRFFSDLTLLADLLNGNWDNERFVICEPGESVPLF